VETTLPYSWYSDPEILRREEERREHNAQTTAQQIGLVTIGIAVAAILFSLVSEWRGRRSAVANVAVEGVHAPDATPPGL